MRLRQQQHFSQQGLASNILPKDVDRGRMGRRGDALQMKRFLARAVAVQRWPQRGELDATFFPVVLCMLLSL